MSLRKSRYALFVMLTAGLASPHFVFAQSEEEKLLEVRGEMEETQARSATYNKEVKALARETEKLRRRLVTITARVMEKEAAVDEAEANLGALEAKEKAAREEFEKKSEALVETIAALQILQQNPPPALLVRPDDALDAARSAILLAEIAPHLKAEADALAFKLTELRLIRGAVEAQKISLLAADKELASERKGLEKMLAKREEKYGAMAARASLERRRLGRLARTARSLEQLLAALEAVLPTFPRMKPALLPEDGSEFASLPQVKPGSAPGLAPGASRGLTSSRGLEIALFSNSRGSLRAPALGRVISRFNQPDGAGGRTKGITIATRPKAQVIAPFDGEVVFAGPYMGYGELLIIEAGEGYHLVLSGLSRIDGMVGQRLLAGEPIGVMGSETRGVASGRQPNGLADDLGGSGNLTSATAKAREAAKPRLYFEMRKNGKPFDPEPWLSGSERKVRG